MYKLTYPLERLWMVSAKLIITCIWFINPIYMYKNEHNKYQRFNLSFIYTPWFFL